MAEAWPRLRPLSASSDSQHAKLSGSQHAKLAEHNQPQRLIIEPGSKVKEEGTMVVHYDLDSLAVRKLSNGEAA
jgi:hypothetical protein